MGLAETIWVIAIFSCIVAIFSIAPIDVAVNSILLSLAILSLVWIHIARKSLSEDSSLKQFASYVFWCLLFMFFFSLWQLVAINFELQSSYIGNVFFAIAYMFLIISTYKLMKIGVEFGFSVQSSGIKKLLKEEKRIKSEKKFKPLKRQ